MKFFVPHARDEAEAEEVWDATRCFLTEQGYRTTARRIRRIAFTHDCETFDLAVGGHHPGMESDPLLTDEPEHPVFRCLVMAILEASDRPCYYVCMPYRGVIRSYPWLVGFNAVSAIEDFEPQPAEPMTAGVKRRRIIGEEPGKAGRPAAPPTGPTSRDLLP